MIQSIDTNDRRPTSCNKKGSENRCFCYRKIRPFWGQSSWFKRPIFIASKIFLRESSVNQLTPPWLDHPPSTKSEQLHSCNLHNICEMGMIPKSLKAMFQTILVVLEHPFIGPPKLRSTPHFPLN